MKKNPTALMAALTLTAIILGVVLLSNLNQQRAEGNMLNAQRDFSMMTAGVVGNNESLVIIDKNSQKMIIYMLDGNNLKVTAAFDFSKAMGGPAAGGAAAK